MCAKLKNVGTWSCHVSYSHTESYLFPKSRVFKIRSDHRSLLMIIHDHSRSHTGEAGRSKPCFSAWTSVGTPRGLRLNPAFPHQGSGFTQPQKAPMDEDLEVHHPRSRTHHRAWGPVPAPPVASSALPDRRWGCHGMSAK